MEPICLDHVFYISKLADTYTRIVPLKWNFSLKWYLGKTHKCKIEAVLVKKWETVNSEITDQKIKKDLSTVLTYKQQGGVNFWLQLMAEKWKSYGWFIILIRIKSVLWLIYYVKSYGWFGIKSEMEVEWSKLSWVTI